MLVRQTLLYIPAQLTGPLVQFLSMIVWTHWLTPEDFGVMTLIMVSHELAYMVALSWFSLYTLRFMPPSENLRDRQAFLRTESTVLLASSLASMIFAVLALRVILDEPPSAGLVVATLIYFLTRSLNMHYAEKMRVNAQIAAYTVLQTVGPLLGFVLGLGLVRQFGADPVLVIAGYAAAQSLALALTARQADMRLDSLRPDPAILSKALRYGAPIILASGMVWFADHGIRFVVKYGVDLAAVGLISVAWGLGRRSTGLAANLVSAAAFSLAVKHMNSGARKDAFAQIGLNGVFLFGVLAPTVAGLWAINDLLVNVLIDERYRSATLEFLPLAVLAGGLRGLRSHYPDQIFLIDDDTRKFILIDGLEGVATIALAILGVIFGGLYGAVLGATLGAAVGAMISFGLAGRTGCLQIFWIDWAKILLASIVMYAAIVMISWPTSPAALAAAIATGGMVYAAALCLLYANKVADSLYSLRQRPA